MAALRGELDEERLMRVALQVTSIAIATGAVDIVAPVGLADWIECLNPTRDVRGLQ